MVLAIEARVRRALNSIVDLHFAEKREEEWW